MAGHSAGGRRCLRLVTRRSDRLDHGWQGTPTDQHYYECAAFIASTGDFDARIGYSGPNDEVGRLAATFNRMIDRLETTFKSQQQFIADSSHELGTPIAVIRGNAELLARPLPPEGVKEAVGAIRSESARMEKIVSDFLKMAELDLAEDDRSQPVRLDQLASEVFSYSRAVAVDQALRLGTLEPALVAGNPDRLRELVLNLVDNAIKYTPEGGVIELTVRIDGEWAQLEVSDTGIGIPPAEHERIFGRFYRVDKARSRASGGTGLGLPIARAIAQAHGGGISVRSRPGSGSIFRVRIPMLA